MKNIKVHTLRRHIKVLTFSISCIICKLSYAQTPAIQLDTATVKEGTYRAIEIRPSGSFNSSNKFYISVVTKITWSASSNPNDPKYINEFTNESPIEKCKHKYVFCYEAPILGIYPISGDNRTIWNVERVYSVFSTSPYIKTNFTPTIATNGSNNLVCTPCERDTLQIVNLSETINKSAYQVPREATVHHYFLVRDKNNDPVEGAVLKYQISGSPEIISSPPTKESGLADLTVKVGGENVESISDDIISAGTQKEISFVDVAIANKSYELLSNAFENPFSISVIDKAEPTEKEFGIGFEIGVGAELVEGTKFRVVPINFEAGVASIGIGGTYSPSLTFVPDNSNPNIWQTKIASPLGVKLNGSIGPKFEGEVGVFGVEGGASIESEASLSSVEEYTYNLDVTNTNHKFFLGAQLFSLGVKLAPGGFLLSNFLYRLAGFSGLAKSEKYGFNVGTQSSFNAGVSFSISKEISKNGEGANFGIGLGAEFKAGLSSNVEFALEQTQSEGVNFSTTISAGTGVNAGIAIGLSAEELEDNLEENLALPFSLASYESQNSFATVLNRHLESFGGNLLDASVAFSNETNKDIAGKSYKLNYVNKLTYSKKAIDRIGLLSNNFVSKFFEDGNTLKAPFTLVSSALSGSGSAFKQIKQYQSQAFGKPKGTLNTADFSTSNTKEVTNINDYSIGFGLTAFLGVEFELGYKEWNKYTLPFKEYKYAKDVDRLLPVIDYPDIESNVQLPTSTPLATFISNLKTSIDNTDISALNAAKSFVTEGSSFLSSVALTFSNSQNGTTLRLGLDAKPFVSSVKNARTNTTPSTFTFNIPASNAAFNTGNEVLFKYYYPENQLSAATLSDTFKLVTDVFFLNARNGNTNLTTAPNGNFTVNTTFNTHELELAGLPLTLTPKVLFQPIGSNTWEIIGDVNQTINFNRLGIFAIGVSLQKDFDPPTITVTPPASFVDGQNFQFTLTDNLSGIDWSKTYFICNGTIVPYQRVGTSNSVNIPIASLHVSGSPLPETFSIQIRTIDLAYNKKSFFNTYPCSKNIKFISILGGGSTLNKHQALETIEVSGSAVIPPSIELKAGKAVLLSPGFNSENSGGYFKAEIGGCNTSGVPAQPANFMVSSAAVCKGQVGVVYTTPNVSGVTYNWSYTGTGATINGAGNSITINFAANATAGTLSVTATNGAGTSPSLTLAINVNTPPTPPTASGVTITSGSTANLTATGCTTYKWYSQPALGTAIHTGQNFTTPALTTTTPYYLACNNGTSCESSRVPVVVTVQ
ncbi:3-coathanger stack domain-containing protein [Runella sp.]|uniref:Ig-like domain-containing protein n=1 Tax=Runella sp. TaxID=1960881 RepID=UPI003D0AA6E0